MIDEARKDIRGLNLQEISHQLEQGFAFILTITEKSLEDFKQEFDKIRFVVYK